jgi:uncharacterized protein YbjT (DUF2867 family)
MNDTILVLGGTGKTGRRVATRLRERGAPVRLGSRSATPPFDWTDQTTWAPVLEGAGAVYVTYHPDLTMPGAPEAIGALAKQAVAAGAQRLVLLSGRGEEEALAAEEQVRDSQADVTIVRSSWFAQNFSEDYLLDSVVEGEVFLPVGDVPEPFIDIEDIADVAVAALTEDGHTGKLYEVTGPRLLTFAEAVAEIAAATGLHIGFTPVPMADYTAAARAQGVPDELVDLFAYLFSTVLDGRNAHLSDGVRQALGRPPGDFGDYARRTAATGVWNRAQHSTDTR